MFWKSITCTAIVCALAVPVWAAPTVTVTPSANGGNIDWAVSVTPDVTEFQANTPLAVELDFQFTGTIMNFAPNTSFWNVSPIDNVGNNPFTGTVTATTLDTAPANDTLFVAAGSELYAAATAQLLGTITTMGAAGGTLSWGNRNVTPSGGGPAYTSSRIAQYSTATSNSKNFDGNTGSVTFPTGGCTLAGDFSCNMSVENADLTLLLNNWSKTVPPTPTGWNGPAPTAPAVDNDELTALLNTWGQTQGGGSVAATGTTVPEPASFALVGLVLAAVAAGRRRMG
jgi:PEP-CTERM motif